MSGAGGDAIVHRPHCEQPDACVARGAGHCRHCHFSSVTKALHADPEFRAAVSAASSARMKALHADPEFRAAASARMKALHADPEFRAKVSAATSARMKALHAEKIKALGLVADELDDWRAIRAKGFSREEAARIVIRSRREVA